MLSKHFLSLKTLALFIAALLVSFRAIAAPPNAIGTFSANSIATAQGSGGCPIMFPSPIAGTTSVTLNITSQSGNVIEGDITITTPAPATITSSVTGTLDAMGLFMVTGSSQISLQGNFDGSSLSVALFGLQYNPSVNCHATDIAFSLTFSPTSGDTINPEEAAGTELKDSSSLRTDVNTVEQPVHTHLRKTMHGDAKGGNLNENGFLIEGEGGLNAGDWQLGNMGVWLSYNYTESEDDFFRTAFESDRHTVVGGIDFTPTENTVLGLAIAYEDSSTDTTFNAGELDSDGFTIAPYLGVLLSETWSLDASVGLSFIDNDQFRTSGGTRITSSPETDRFYISSNLNGITFVDNWILGGRVGFLYARSSTEDFTESDGTAVAKRTTKLGQFRIGGDAAYSYGNWEPFVSALYGYDFSFDEVRLTTGAQPENDRDDILLSFGVRYFNNNNWSGNFEYSKRVFREDFDEDSWTATIRYDF